MYTESSKSRGREGFPLIDQPQPASTAAICASPSLLRQLPLERRILRTDTEKSITRKTQRLLYLYPQPQSLWCTGRASAACEHHLCRVSFSQNSRQPCRQRRPREDAQLLGDTSHWIHIIQLVLIHSSSFFPREKIRLRDLLLTSVLPTDETYKCLLFFFFFFNTFPLSPSWKQKAFTADQSPQMSVSFSSLLLQAFSSMMPWESQRL